MPWRETSVMDERTEFVGRLLWEKRWRSYAWNLEYHVSPVIRYGTGTDKTVQEVFLTATEPRKNMLIRRFTQAVTPENMLPNLFS